MKACLAFYAAMLVMISLPCAAYFLGYQLTEEYFKRKVIPFPFENFGATVGLGCFFWTLGILILIRTLYHHWRKPA